LIQFSKEEIGCILKELRLNAGMTQAEVADALLRKRQIVGHWETGYSQPDTNTLLQLCDLYGADIGETFGLYRKVEVEVSQHERAILEAYRSSPDFFQVGIATLLQVDRKDETQKPLNTVRLFRAAKSESGKPGGIVDMPNEVLDTLRSTPVAKPSEYN